MHAQRQDKVIQNTNILLPLIHSRKWRYKSQQDKSDPRPLKASF